MRETERKFTLIKIEEGAKKFVATNVDDDVKSLSAKLKHFTESELGNLLKAEMENDGIGPDNIERRLYQHQTYRQEDGLDHERTVA